MFSHDICLNAVEWLRQKSRYIVSEIQPFYEVELLWKQCGPDCEVDLTRSEFNLLCSYRWNSINDQIHNNGIWLYVSQSSPNTGWGYSRMGCCGKHSILRGTRWQGSGENYIKEELYDLSSSPNIIRAIKPRIMRWVGHVALMGGQEICVQLLGEETWGKPFGR